MRLFTILYILVLTSSHAFAAEMRFEFGGPADRCPDCGWIQGNGEITASTPGDFEQFIHRFKFFPKILRLQSIGGEVRASIELGQKLRAEGFATEVGSDAPIPNALNFGEGRASESRPGFCISACAYAFLGGIRRSLNGQVRYGVHRFFPKSAIVGPKPHQFTGEDFDRIQRLSADLIRYVIQMGVDPRLIALASEAGPDGIRWINAEEARELRIIYDPDAWRPWRVETYRGGAVAISETNDGKIKLVALCTQRMGPEVVLTDRTQSDESWFKQIRRCASHGKHPVFGTFVDQSQVDVFRPDGGGAAIRFRLATKKLSLTSAAVFEQFSDSYPATCTTTRYRGSTENFAPAVNLAFRNCTNDN